ARAPAGGLSCTRAELLASSRAAARLAFPLAPLSPAGQPLGDRLLVSFPRRLVERRPPDQRVGQIRLVRDEAPLEVVRVAIALTVAFGLHQGRGRVAELLWDGEGAALADLLARRLERPSHRARLGRGREVEASVGDGVEPFRHAETVKRLIGGN